MSHSKIRKKGNSFYLDSWNPEGKKYVLVCNRCGAIGYSPNILNQDFGSTLEKRTIKNELMSILNPIYLDQYGSCSHCSDYENEKLNSENSCPPTKRSL